MNSTILLILVVGILVAGVVTLTKNSPKRDMGSSVNNVSIVGGKQIVNLTAKGGYSPTKSTAKAGIPTILRVGTNGTFDCSASLRIPSMDVSKNLQPNGTTDIDLGSPKIGTLQGTCGMGMYLFAIYFT